MKINLSFAELHTPLFLKGVNHGVKLYTEKRQVKLTYDRTYKELHVEFNGSMAVIPLSNVVSMTPVDANDLEDDFEAVPYKDGVAVGLKTKKTDKSE